MDTERVKIASALEHQKQFKWKRRIGNGSFGTVVEASCMKSGESYAIKIIPVENNDEPKWGLYQKRELKLLTKLKLSGQNVIKFIGYWFLQVGPEKQLCIQMELCSTSLGNFVYNNKIRRDEIVRAQTTPRFYQQVFPQILNGLYAIHSLGWVHRDLHPGNILIANPNPQEVGAIKIKIADFGLARFIGTPYGWATPLTKAPALEELSPRVGNLLYRAPELWKDKYDCKVDMYSAGMVLYFISRYTCEMESELKALKAGQIKVEEKLQCHGEEKLYEIIKNLLQGEEDAYKRYSAREATEYLFPTKPRDATDSSPNLTSGSSEITFFARKESGENLNRCRISEFTLPAIKKAIEIGTGVEIDKQDLQQERNGVKRPININSNKDIEEMFLSAEKEKQRVEIVVSEKHPEEEIEISELQIDTLE